MYPIRNVRKQLRNVGEHVVAIGILREAKSYEVIVAARETYVEKVFLCPGGDGVAAELDQLDIVSDRFLNCVGDQESLEERAGVGQCDTTKMNNQCVVVQGFENADCRRLAGKPKDLAVITTRIRKETSYAITKGTMFFTGFQKGLILQACEVVRGHATPVKVDARDPVSSVRLSVREFVMLDDQCGGRQNLKPSLARNFLGVL